MRARQLMGAVGAMVLLMGWGGSSPARSELKAVVEDSTTIVVIRGDSVVFRMEMGFAASVTPRLIRLAEPGFGAVVVLFDYAAKDTILVNPLPLTYTFTAGGRGPWRSHLLLIDEAGHERLSTDVLWHGLHPGGVALLSSDTLCVVYRSLGEFIVVDIPSGTSKLVRLSDKGCGCGDEEPCGIALIKMMDRDIVVSRTDLFNVCGHGSLSEVALVSPSGVIHWRQEYRNEEVRILEVDSDASVVVIGSLVGPPDGGNRVRVLSQDGELSWQETLEGLPYRRLEVGGGVLAALSPSGQTVLLRDLKTGKPVEQQP
ncbi:hypothetical protein JXA88_13765 [Candidatus Fermentibacteria bacterium]|nr:hypothetical protein [Candidatus Fermentibacteria bacterium]